MNISINRALSELKLLNKKIADKTSRLEVATGVQKADDSVKETFISTAKANIQSILDLIKRRNIIKSAIVQSNAATTVTVGSNSMTVAEAIERKTSIELEKGLNRRMREQYYSNKNGIEAHNQKAKATANEQVEKMLGTDTEGDKAVQAKAIFDVSYDANKAELIAPEGIEALIEKDQDAIDEFENEVDFILSESNTKTMIEA